MAGALRNTMVWLGFAEDERDREDYYDDEYDTHAEADDRGHGAYRHEDDEGDADAGPPAPGAVADGRKRLEEEAGERPRIGPEVARGLHPGTGDDRREVLRENGIGRRGLHEREV